MPGGGRPVSTGTDAVRPLMRTMPRPPPTERTRFVRAGDNDLVPRVLRVSAALGWRLLVVVAALYVIGIVVSYLAAVVVPVAVALLLAALLSPAVHSAAGTRRAPGVATALVMIGGLAVLGGVLTFVVITFVRGVPALAAQLSTSVNTIVNWLTTGPLQLSARQLAGLQTQVLDTLSANQSTITVARSPPRRPSARPSPRRCWCCSPSSSSSTAAPGSGSSCSAWCPTTSAPASTSPAAAAWPRWSATSGPPRSSRSSTRSPSASGWPCSVSRWPYRWPRWCSSARSSRSSARSSRGSVAVLVALVANGPVAALIVLGIIIAVMQLEGHVLQPLLLGRAVKLHPLAVVLAIAAGLVVAGIAGALLAVPLLAVLNSGIRSLRSDRRPARRPRRRAHQRPGGDRPRRAGLGPPTRTDRRRGNAMTPPPPRPLRGSHHAPALHLGSAPKRPPIMIGYAAS